MSDGTFTPDESGFTAVSPSGAITFSLDGKASDRVSVVRLASELSMLAITIFRDIYDVQHHFTPLADTLMKSPSGSVVFQLEIDQSNHSPDYETSVLGELTNIVKVIQNVIEMYCDGADAEYQATVDNNV